MKQGKLGVVVHCGVVLAALLVFGGCSQPPRSAVLSPRADPPASHFVPTRGPDGLPIPMTMDRLERMRLVSRSAPNPVAPHSSGVRFGIWFPYDLYNTNAGVPPMAAMVAAGINPTFLTGDIDANVLASYDVLFFGRAGMIGDFPPGAGVIQDIDALIDWVRNGGGIIGESNALLWDSDYFRSTNWSSRLSVVAGISAPSAEYDYAVSNLPVAVTSPGHPLALGVSGSFTLQGSYAHKVGTVIDLGKNPTTVEVARVSSEPVSVARYGNGCAVNFPSAVGYIGIDWGANPDYQRLFINAVLHCGTHRATEVEIDIKPGSNANPVGLVGAGNGRGEAGRIPVAVLTTASFDASTVDGSTVTLGDDNGVETPANSRGSGDPMPSLEDVDGDGDQDLVLHFDLAVLVSNGDLTPSTTRLCLNGKTHDGTSVHGCDAVRVPAGGGTGKLPG